MKTNEAPEKIYLEKIYPDNGVLPNGLNYNQSSNDIEYTRTDAFIEKACDAFCSVCDTKECEGCAECIWIINFRKQLMKLL